MIVLFLALLCYVASSQSNDGACSYAGIMVMTKDVVSCDVHVTACALAFSQCTMNYSMPNKMLWHVMYM